jgi:hypothetical protein
MLAGRHGVGEAAIEGGHLPFPPGEPLLAQRTFDERRPPLEPTAGRIDAGKHGPGEHRRLLPRRSDESAERRVIEPPRHTGRVEPAVVRKNDRDPIDGRRRADAVGQLRHETFDDVLHPMVEDVVADRPRSLAA